MLVQLESISEWANGDVRTMKEIIHLFVDNTPPTLDLLEKAIHESDWENIVRYAHKLKSSYGIVIIGNSLPIIQGIEQGGKDKGDQARILQDFAEVRRLYNAAQAEFEAFNRDNP